MSFTITVKQNPLQIAFEVGSIAEAVEIIQNEKTALGQLIRDVAAVNAADGDSQPDESATVNEPGDSVPTPAGETAKRRGRPPKNKNQPDPATAAAPPPAPVPPLVGGPAPGIQPPAFVSAPAVPAPAGGTDPGPIPDFLDRKKQDTAPSPAAAAPSPAAPPPPPAPAPAAPALSPLKEQVTAALKERTKGATDGGKAYADWLAQMGIVVPNCTFDEALAVIVFESDEKLQPVAAALGIS